MTVIVDLPTEILTEIFRYLPVTSTSNLTGGLGSVSLVNKRFNGVATPLLYQRMRIHFRHLIYLKQEMMPSRSIVESDDIINGSDPMQVYNHNVRFIRDLCISEQLLTIDEHYDFEDGSTSGSEMCEDEILGQLSMGIEGQMDNHTLIVPRPKLNFIEGIRPDQLLSLSLRHCKEMRIPLAPQTQIRELCVDLASLRCLEIKIPELLGITSAAKLVFSGHSRLSIEWNTALQDLMRLKTRIRKLSLLGMEGALGLLILCGLVYSNCSTLRVLEIEAEPGKLMFRDGEMTRKDTLIAAMDQLKRYDVDLRKLNVRGLGLEELTLRRFLWWESFSDKVFNLLDLERLKKLKLVRCDYVDAICRSILPKTRHFSDLRIIHLCQNLSIKFIALIPSRLRVLQIISNSQFFNITKELLEPHREFLEVLCVQNAPGGKKQILPLRDSKQLDWMAMIDGFFPRLKEVAACLPHNFAANNQIVMTLKSQIRLLCILNPSDFKRRGVRPRSIAADASSCIEQRKSLNSDSQLKMIVFGQVYDKNNLWEAYLLSLDEIGKKFTRTRFTKATLQEAQICYPDLEILDDLEKIYM